MQGKGLAADCSCIPQVFTIARVIACATGGLSPPMLGTGRALEVPRNLVVSHSFPLSCP